MVELTIAIPVLIIIIFSIVQMGIVLNRVQAFHAAAREGARVASLEDTTKTDISNRVDDALVGLNLTSSPTVTVTPNTTKPCAGRPGQQVSVKVTSTYAMKIPLLPDQTLNLSGDGVFRCE